MRGKLWIVSLLCLVALTVELCESQEQKVGPQRLKVESQDKPVASLIIQLGDRDELVRRKAAKALGEIGADAKAAVPTLIQALRDESDRVRRNAAFALGRIGEATAEAVPALIQALNDEK